MSTVDGNRVWAVDASGTVVAYDGGVYSSEWAASGVVSAGGIAASGADLWIVDNELDQLLYFANGAAMSEGVHAATASYALDPANGAASGIASDGQFVWIVDSVEDKVFKYNATGLIVGSWSLDPANVDPQGITNDPTGFGNSLWVVDASTDQVFAYDDGANYVAGSQTATTTYPLAVANGSPRGISTPLPAWLLAQTPPTEPDAPSERVSQDVNNDGVVSARDALIIINRITRVEGESAEATDANHFPDVNGDAKVTAARRTASHQLHDAADERERRRVRCALRQANSCGDSD